METNAEFHKAVLEFNLERDPMCQQIMALQEGIEVELRAVEATILHIRRLLDGEGISEMERLRRRIAELEALLGEREG